MNLDLRGPAAAVAYKLLTNIVMPRPIAWVTSRDAKGGLNLAPFSFFNLVGSAPPSSSSAWAMRPRPAQAHRAQHRRHTRLCRQSRHRRLDGSHERHGG
jgi:flavin reductase (DIM6/NTAB) family NADH-FMN oxidoreductase RutF